MAPLLCYKIDLLRIEFITIVIILLCSSNQPCLSQPVRSRRIALSLSSNDDVKYFLQLVQAFQRRGKSERSGLAYISAQRVIYFSLLTLIVGFFL